jgi:ABC-type long-subunit fatty acid transport system fused permease/ATPase subunit
MLSYDADGKLIIKNIMAQLGGDQEYFIESESTVINDSTYRKTTKEFEYSINSNSNELKNTKTEELNIPN